MVAEIGPNASGGCIEEALDFGEIFMISIPYGSLPAFGQQYGAQPARKIVMQTGNPTNLGQDSLTA